MKIELLLIGSELLNGQVLDKNSHWFLKFLEKYHLTLYRITTLGDDEELMIKTIEKAYAESDVVVLSGGLGLTLDDKTKDVLAKVFSAPLEYHEEAYQFLKESLEARKRDAPDPSHPYTKLPQGFFPLKNTTGMAPGLAFGKPKKLLLSLPGVPHEFENILTSQFFPLLHRFHFPALPQKIKLVYRTKMLPEEKIFKTIAPTLWQELSQFGEISSLPHPLSVDIVISVPPTSDEELEKIKKNITKIFQQYPLLSESLWQIGNLSLEELIIQEAAKRRLTLALAESCTGGYTSHLLTNISGSSQVFLGGVVSYANQVKTQFLGVAEESLIQYGAVSKEVAQEMSEGIVRRFHSSLGLSLTGIAGPSGGSEKKPVGTICIGVTKGEKTKTYQYQFFGSRSLLKESFSKAAMFCLLDLIRSEN